MVQLPTVSWPAADAAPETFAMACPNCGAEVGKPVLGRVNWQTPDHPARSMRILRCPACTCCFYDNQSPPDYADPVMLESGRQEFYLQQGAGVGLITAPLTRIARPPGSIYLEVGCGFGFGLDFALRARAWQGRGIDPAGISELGARLLGVPVTLDYFTPGMVAAQSCDVIMGSEVIEHVKSPPAFVRDLRAALKPDGVLILTTPDGAEIGRDVPVGVLVPLLSPGLHLVFQNAGSLERLLRDAGFTEVVVERDGLSLIAYASAVPLRLEADPARRRALYRGYLADRAAGLSADDELFFAFAGRALMESVNDGDFATAGRVWPSLAAALKSRHRIEPDVIAALPAEEGSSLGALARAMPINLGGILLARTYWRISTGIPRAAVRRQFEAAAAAARAVLLALGALAMQDGNAEDVEWTAGAEAVLCAAAAGSEDALSGLADLPPAPGPTGAARRREIALRALVEMVNAGHYKLGRTLADGEKLIHLAFAAGTSTGPMGTAERDALFCLAMLDWQVDDNLALAARRFAMVCHSFPPAAPGARAHPLLWSALRGELICRDRLGEAEPATLGARRIVDALGAGAEDMPEDLRGRLMPAVNAE